MADQRAEAVDHRSHLATHVWLAVRTDPEPHPQLAGITVFLVPTDKPGIIVVQHTALSGGASCTVFCDDDLTL